MTKVETGISQKRPQVADGLRKGSKSRKRNENFLPLHIGESFQSQLIDLVDQLALEEGFKGQYLRSELLTKFCDSSTTPPEERASAALAKWLQTEERNSLTNQRIQLGDVDFGWLTSDRLLAETRKIIRGVIGARPDHNLFVGSCHTNGASSRIGRGVTAAASKCTGTAHVTSAAQVHWSRLVSNTKFEDQTLEVVASSVLFTVPKSSHIDRVACKEPEINMFLQRAVGDHIRGRLKKFGVNLNDQTVNQKLARDALRRGLATVDLSAASDSISRQLVFELLPFEWWSLMDDIRSKSVILPDGTLHDLEMFSSMGNGFTFELESLIFWALTRVVARFTACRGRISVYGDDIICPNGLVPALTQIFHWVGFKVNTKKSHWRGLFRESCGKHYHNSYDVSPFFIRVPVTTVTDVIRLLNRLFEWDARDTGFFVNPSAAAFHRKWRKAIPTCLWGGVDVESTSALVTGHAPRSRLVRRSNRVPRSEDGAMLHWFAVKERENLSRFSYVDSDPLIQDNWIQKLKSIRWFGATGSQVSEEQCGDDYMERSPFCVDAREQGKYFIQACPTYSNSSSVSYGERTTWFPDLIWE